MFTKNQKRKRIRHEFLLTFFNPEEKYQVKDINGFVLVKQFNGNNKSWEVAIYTKDSFNKREQYILFKK